MCLFAGLIVMMDLRIVGVAYTDTPVSQVQKRLFPGQMLGMACSSQEPSWLSSPCSYSPWKASSFRRVAGATRRGAPGNPEVRVRQDHTAQLGRLE